MDQQPRHVRALEQLAKLLGTGFKHESHPWHTSVSTQLEAYFAHLRKDFDIPLIYPGTAFQRSVWEYLLGIPAGSTRSYLQQSIDLGDKKAIRAVAHANGSNRISILIPCHRVIGSDKSLTGYGGGLDRKKQLLQHELFWSTGTLF
jgi:O-6-methylguanine DNA methyltransferase